MDEENELEIVDGVIVIGDFNALFVTFNVINLLIIVIMLTNA
jgi:hypothetical protein